MFNRDFTLQSILTGAVARLILLLGLIMGLLLYYMAERQYRFEQALFQQKSQLMAQQLEALLTARETSDPQKQVRQWSNTVDELLPEISYELTFDDETVARNGITNGKLLLQISLSVEGWVLLTRTSKTPLFSILFEPLVIFLGVLILALVIFYFWGKKLAGVMLQDLEYIENTASLLVAEKSDSMIVEPRLYIREYKDFFSQLKKIILGIRKDVDRAFSRDPLTAMPDQNQLDHQKKKLYEMASRSVEMVLVMLDIDDLKSTNMMYGDETGDRLIKGIGDIVKGAIRSTDDSFYLGNGQFLIVLVGMKPAEALKWYEFMTRRYDMLRLNLGEYLDDPPQISVSGSAAQVSPTDNTLDDTLQRLRTVLKSVKKRSKGIIVMAREMQNPDSVKTQLHHQNKSSQAEQFHHPWQ